MTLESKDDRQAYEFHKEEAASFLRKEDLARERFGLWSFTFTRRRPFSGAAWLGEFGGCCGVQLREWVGKLLPC